MLQQERELDKLMKRCAASRLALLRNQANKMFLLEQALKGWFNPKKVRAVKNACLTFTLVHSAELSRFIVFVAVGGTWCFHGSLYGSDGQISWHSCLLMESQISFDLLRATMIRTVVLRIVYDGFLHQSD